MHACVDYDGSVTFARSATTNAADVFKKQSALAHVGKFIEDVHSGCFFRRSDHHHPCGMQTLIRSKIVDDIWRHCLIVVSVAQRILDRAPTSLLIWLGSLRSPPLLQDLDAHRFQCLSVSATDPRPGQQSPALLRCGVARNLTN